FTQHKQFTAIYETSKRSVYLMQQRIKKHPFLATFDAADPNSSTAERTVSTTPLQALFMMNDEFAHEQASHFASRLPHGSEPDRITAAYQIASGRLPAREEIDEARQYLHGMRQKLRSRSSSLQEEDQLAWTSLARVILSSNEFLFVD